MRRRRSDHSLLGRVVSGNPQQAKLALEPGLEGILEDLPGLRGGTAGVNVAEDEEMEGLGLKEYVRVHTAKLERARIQRALENEDHNVTRAARRLGISRKSLQTKMKEYGLRNQGS